MILSETILKQNTFFHSSLCLENSFQTFDDFLNWFYKKKKEGNFEVKIIPFNKLDNWYFTEGQNSLVHQSGKFFRIEGIRVQTNFGKVKEWEQPIINQPEIGILGIISKKINGVRYFLMQAKMEPGNVNILQLSPTVQATKSNYSKVHKGKSTPYLEYFIDSRKSKILIDQLQSEQGGRFLRKRNRNMVVEVDQDIEVLSDFCWLTLGEIKKVLGIDNFVNMDARSVLSTFPLIDEELILNDSALTLQKTSLTDKLNLDLINSACSDKGQKTMSQLISWYTSQKVEYELTVESISLSELNGWSISNESIFSNKRFFSVIAVEIIAGTREVNEWTQPLIKDNNIGLLGFIAKKIDGILHFLIQAKVEPGNLDIIELSPTVSCSNIEYIKNSKSTWPLFFEYFFENKNGKILFNALQSEEGGRFYHLQNRNIIIEVDESEELELPSNYVWMTLRQMSDFMKYSMFNIEARSLISCLSFLSK